MRRELADRLAPAVALVSVAMAVLLGALREKPASPEPSSSTQPMLLDDFTGEWTYSQDYVWGRIKIEASGTTRFEIGSCGWSKEGQRQARVEGDRLVFDAPIVAGSWSFSSMQRKVTESPFVPPHERIALIADSRSESTLQGVGFVSGPAFHRGR